MQQPAAEPKAPTDTAKVEKPTEAKPVPIPALAKENKKEEAKPATPAEAPKTEAAKPAEQPKKVAK
jgi:hypothetical protein